MLGQRILSHMKVTWLSEGEADTLRAQPLSYDCPAAGVNSADTDLRLLERSPAGCSSSLTSRDDVGLVTALSLDTPKSARSVSWWSTTMMDAFGSR